jgi:hypothetical protein
MVKINIPDNVNVANDQFVQSLVSEVAAQVESQVQPYYAGASDAVDGEFLILCLQNEISRRKAMGGKEYRDNPDAFWSAINRPDVFLSSKSGHKYVRGFEDLMTFCSSIAAEDIKLERDYTGHDHAEVCVLRVKIPQHYVARVAYIKLKHVPRRFLTSEDSVLVKMLPPKKKEQRGEMALLCRELQPVWTDRNLFEISKETIQSEYGYITMKVRKEDYSVKSWFPGVDKNCNVCAGREDDFVLVGQQYHSKPAMTRLTINDLR